MEGASFLFKHMTGTCRHSHDRQLVGGPARRPLSCTGQAGSPRDHLRRHVVVQEVVHVALNCKERWKGRWGQCEQHTSASVDQGGSIGGVHTAGRAHDSGATLATQAKKYITCPAAAQTGTSCSTPSWEHGTSAHSCRNTGEAAGSRSVRGSQDPGAADRLLRCGSSKVNLPAASPALPPTHMPCSSCSGREARPIICSRSVTG